ncbi:hypothetical protein F4680DRAFT_450863 [Xylaria scruposa]|nr:hypothetical protein F4680DRAFT_450863 [Xylaria scruposa]
MNSTHSFSIFSESVHSRRRSSRLIGQPSAVRHAVPFPNISGSVPVFNPYKTLDQVIEMIVNSQLPGPVHIFGRNEYLGQSGQFVVSKQDMGWFDEQGRFRQIVVAVKQPKFRLDPNTTLDLGDPSVRKHLHAIYLEFAALTHPELSRDPSIIRLLSWSFDSDTFHALISLVMELARGDL